MGYSSNKKFSTYTDNIGLIIDGCGNTYEDKYYVNGMYIDLCGLSVKEYMNNPCCGGSNIEEDKKQVNEILIKSFTGDNNVIYYQAISKFPVTSNIKISVVSTNNIMIELEINIGETQSESKIGDTKEFFNINMNIKEDETYNYITVIEEESEMTCDIYFKAVPLLMNDYSNDFDKISVEMESSANVKFTIPPTDFNYNELEDVNEFEKFCIDNQYCLSLCIPKLIYDNKYYLLQNYNGTDITNKFTFVKNFSLNNKEYVLLNEKGTDNIMSYVPLYKEDLIYVYKLILKK